MANDLLEMVSKVGGFVETRKAEPAARHEFGFVMKKMISGQHDSSDRTAVVSEERRQPERMQPAGHEHSRAGKEASKTLQARHVEDDSPVSARPVSPKEEAPAVNRTEKITDPEIGQEGEEQIRKPAVENAAPTPVVEPVTQPQQFFIVQIPEGTAVVDGADDASCESVDAAGQRVALLFRDVNAVKEQGRGSAEIPVLKGESAPDNKPVTPEMPAGARGARVTTQAGMPDTYAAEPAVPAPVAASSSDVERAEPVVITNGDGESRLLINGVDAEVVMESDQVQAGGSSETGPAPDVKKGGPEKLGAVASRSPATAGRVDTVLKSDPAETAEAAVQTAAPEMKEALPETSKTLAARLAAAAGRIETAPKSGPVAAAVEVEQTVAPISRQSSAAVPDEVVSSLQSEPAVVVKPDIKGNAAPERSFAGTLAGADVTLKVSDDSAAVLQPLSEAVQSGMPAQVKGQGNPGKQEPARPEVAKTTGLTVGMKPIQAQFDARGQEFVEPEGVPVVEQPGVPAEAVEVDVKSAQTAQKGAHVEAHRTATQRADGQQSEISAGAQPVIRQTSAGNSGNETGTGSRNAGSEPAEKRVVNNLNGTGKQEPTGKFDGILAAQAPDSSSMQTAGAKAGGPQHVLHNSLTRTETLQSLAEKIDSHILNMVTGKDNSMTINLNPKNLGKIVINCRETGTDISFSIVADSQAASGVIKSHEDAIRDLVSSSGFKLTDFDVRSQGDDAARKQQVFDMPEFSHDRARKTAAAGSGDVESVRPGEARVDRNGRLWFVA